MHTAEQITRERDLLERCLLRAKARFLRAAHEIDEELGRLQQARREQATGEAMGRIAHEARPRISLELLDG